jgi:outer membrane protein OmpA-like peptidoglycan-associated protein
MENVVRKDTRGVIETIDAKYELLPRGMYISEGKGKGFLPVRVDKKNPFELYEAENAVMLARVAGADTYAADSFQKALDALDWAHRNQAQKPGQKPVITMAREAALRAEDSRVIAIRAQREEALAQERAASLARETASAAKADDEARERARADRQRAEADRARADADTQRLKAESLRAAAETDRAAAERARADAMAATAQANAAKLDAERARQEAIDQQQKLASEADLARAATAKAQQEQAELRQKLMIQFNQILQTRETARGLIVNMSDVLFDTAKYTLKPGAREKLAKISGIILAHPGLTITVEGHTDSVGGDEYNMKLSEDRANSVRAYLVAQGLDSGIVTAHGFGKTRPVADNSSAAGRQQNRRVEMVVAGDVLGTSASATTDIAPR